jgi:hypothetical protein
MRKYTQRAIKDYVRTGAALDITNYSFTQAQALHRAHSLTTVGVSSGVYGLNGALLQDESGTLYAITARNSTLAQLV